MKKEISLDLPAASIVLLPATIIVLLLACSCNNRAELPPLSFSGEPAPEWTALMERTSGGFEADGIFTIPLNGVEEQQVPGKRTLFVFSDTYIGQVMDNMPLPGNVMVNNTMAWMIGVVPCRDSVIFTYNTPPGGTPVSYFVPDNETLKEVLLRQRDPGEYAPGRGT